MSTIEKLIDLSLDKRHITYFNEISNFLYILDLENKSGWAFCVGSFPQLFDLRLQDNTISFREHFFNMNDHQDLAWFSYGSYIKIDNNMDFNDLDFAQEKINNFYLNNKQRNEMIKEIKDTCLSAIESLKIKKEIKNKQHSKEFKI